MEKGVYRVHRAVREVSPAFTLSQIGKAALSRAREEEGRAYLDLVTAQLMCALALEAVLNHVGAKLFLEDSKRPSLWKAVERLSPRDKALALAEQVGLDIDWGVLPFQDFQPIFRFRNQLAHAKSMRLAVEDVPITAFDEDELLDERCVPGLQAEWEESISLDTAERWQESTRKMADILCKAADCTSPMLLGDHMTWVGSRS
ncbi:MAG: hypothetical protein Kow0056_09220 [Coriobacteriia bacterium]